MIPNRFYRESNVLVGFGRMSRSLPERKKNTSGREKKYTKTWN